MYQMTWSKMNISKLLTLIFLSSFIVYNEAASFYTSIHGRPEGGFLGQPVGDDSLLGSAPPTIQVTDHWYRQKLDHFNSEDARTFNQKYYTNSTFFRSGGPLFILIGGESAIGASWMMGGAWMKYAQRYNAYCVQLEHRFYGDTHPFDDLSTDNLQYLTIRQALADLADFVQYMKMGQSFSQVIAFGGSYSGSLAAWFRLKYPHIVNGAVASSAGVHPLVNFKGYLENVDSSIRYYYPNGNCNNAIRSATAAIKENLKTLSGQQNLKSLFNLCYDIDAGNANDVSMMFGILAENFKTTTQYNNDHVALKTANITVSDLCSIMTNTANGDPLHRYAQVNTQLLTTNGYTCVNQIYSSAISNAKQTSWDSAAAKGNRQWTYQTCTQLGYFQTTDSQKQPFGDELPIDYWNKKCSDIFGSVFTPSFIESGIASTVAEYWTVTTNTSRVIFINGNIDPWHTIGVLDDAGPNNTVIYINGTAHCADMYSQSFRDVPELLQARITISDTIGLWLQSPEPSYNTAQSLHAYSLALFASLALAYSCRY